MKKAARHMVGQMVERGAGDNSGRTDNSSVKIERPINSFILENLVLIRLLAAGHEGLSEVQLRRDLHPVIMQLMSNREWHQMLGRLIVDLVERNLLRPVRANAYIAQNQAFSQCLLFLRLARWPDCQWHELRDGYIIALANGLEPTQKRISKIITADGLRRAILISHYKFDLELGEEPSDLLRIRLAQLALLRKTEKANLSKNQNTCGEVTSDNLAWPRLSDYSVKNTVTLASELLDSRQPIESEAELLAKLAAQKVGAVNESAQELRQMLFRRFIMSEMKAVPDDAEKKWGARSEPKEPVDQSKSSRNRLGAKPSGVHIHLSDFAAEVKDLAESQAEGWPGNKRAFISHVWREIALRYPGWGLSEADFKEMILAAHRAGHLRLAIADLRDKSNMDDITASRTTYKNSEWHFIRVEDDNDHC